MRTFSLSTGDSGDTGDKAVITASRRVPTTKRAGGNTGDKFTRREAGSCLAALSPVSNARVGTRRDAVFMGLSPPSPVVPTKTRLKRCHGGKLCRRHEGGRFTMKRGGNVREQSRAPGPADCLRTRQAPADCQTCGTALVTIRHTPMRLPGSHCSNCCPCCAAQRVHSTGPGSEGGPGKSGRFRP